MVKLQKIQKTFYFLLGFTISLIVIISLFPFLETPSGNDGTPVVTIHGENIVYSSVSNTDVYNALRQEEGMGTLVNLLVQQAILAEYIDFTDVMHTEVDNRVKKFENQSVVSGVPIHQLLRENDFNTMAEYRAFQTVDVMLRYYTLQEVEFNRENIATKYQAKVVDIIRVSTEEEAKLISEQLTSGVPLEQIKLTNKNPDNTFEQAVLYNGIKRFNKDIIAQVYQMLRYDVSEPVLYTDAYYVFRMVDNDPMSQQTLTKLANTDTVKNSHLTQLLSNYTLSYKENFK